MSRYEVLRKYKELLYLCRDYPLGYQYARNRLHAAFRAQSALQTPAGVDKALAKAEYIRKEIEVMYYLKKYRALRQRYDLSPTPA